ncbi:hypothetical protein ABLN73_01460, partial [Mycobacterium tuberculosis]
MLGGSDPALVAVPTQHESLLGALRVGEQI